MTTDKNAFLYIVYITYFCCGLTQCIEGIFLPEFKTHFNLNYTEQMYIMFAKNFPFAVCSIPFGYAVFKLGYKQVTRHFGDGFCNWHCPAGPGRFEQ